MGNERSILMAKKYEIVDVFMDMWNAQDQAGQQGMVNEALIHMPVVWLKTQIEMWISCKTWNTDLATWDYIDELIKKAKRLICNKD
jgi:hypothetical protein